MMRRASREGESGSAWTGKTWRMAAREPLESRQRSAMRCQWLSRELVAARCSSRAMFQRRMRGTRMKSAAVAAQRWIHGAAEPRAGSGTGMLVTIEAGPRATRVRARTWGSWRNVLSHVTV